MNRPDECLGHYIGGTTCVGELEFQAQGGLSKAAVT